MSRLGIQSGRRRITFLLALPAIVVAMMLAAAAFGSISVFALHRLRAEWVFDIPIDLNNAWRVVAIVVPPDPSNNAVPRLVKSIDPDNKINEPPVVSKVVASPLGGFPPA